MVNWNGAQTPRDPKTKKAMALNGVKPRHLAGGSWHADASKEGKLRSGHLTTVGTIGGLKAV